MAPSFCLDECPPEFRKTRSKRVIPSGQSRFSASTCHLMNPVPFHLCSSLEVPDHIQVVPELGFNMTEVPRSEHSNHAIDCAGSGVEAVEKWNRAEYDLVFMEVQMPVMDGLETTHAARAQEKKSNPEGAPLSHGCPRDGGWQIQMRAGGTGFPPRKTHGR